MKELFLGWPFGVQVLCVYLLLISVISIVLTCYDKAIANKKNHYRIPEKTLLWLGALGGALFMYLTMRLIHHKTLHKKFMICLPLFFVLHLAIAVAFIFFI